MLIPILQQATTSTATTLDLPQSVQGALIVLILFAAKEIPSRLITYLDLRIQEHKKRVDALETANLQIDKLFKRIDAIEERADRAELRVDQQREEHERKFTEQGQRHDREIAELGEKYTKMTEQYDEQGVLLTASAARIKTLEGEKQELARQRDEEAEKRKEAEQQRDDYHDKWQSELKEKQTLADRLKLLETGSHKAVPEAPSTEPPTPEEAPKDSTPPQEPLTPIE